MYIYAKLMIIHSIHLLYSELIIRKSFFFTFNFLDLI